MSDKDKKTFEIKIDESGVITNYGLEALEKILILVKTSITSKKRQNRKGTAKIEKLPGATFDAYKEMLALVPDPQLVKDFLSAKKKAGSDFSKTIFNRFVKICRENDWELSVIMLLNMTKRWRGFEAHWVTNLKQQELEAYGIKIKDYVNITVTNGARNNSGQGYEPAKTNINGIIQQFSDDASMGNIPGVYKTIGSDDVGENG